MESEREGRFVVCPLPRSIDRGSQPLSGNLALWLFPDGEIDPNVQGDRADVNNWSR